MVYNTLQNRCLLNKTVANRSVYVIAFRTARIFWLKRIIKWPAVRTAPGTAGGLPPGVTVFANARIK